MTQLTTLKALPMIIATGLVSACGGATTTGGGPMIDQAPNPTATPAAIATTVSRIGAANAVPIPPTPATGSATFSGGMLADATIDGVNGQKIFANIDASANLFNGTFSGSMQNFNLVSAGNIPTEGIDGALNFNGSSSSLGKTATANATGSLEGNFGGDTRETVRMSVGLDGRVRGPNIFDNMSTISGDISGGSTNGQPVDISLNGDFYLRDDL